MRLCMLTAITYSVKRLKAAAKEIGIMVKSNTCLHVFFQLKIVFSHLSQINKSCSPNKLMVY